MERVQQVRYLSSVYVAIGVLMAQSPVAAGIIADAQLRSVVADADTSSGLEFNTESMGEQAPDLTAYSSTVAAEGHTQDADALSSADHMSTISDSEIAGSGSATASGDLRAEGVAFAEGDSFLEVLFQVDTAGTYLFSGMLDASGSGGTGLVISELLDLTADETLAIFSVDTGESEEFDSEFVLIAGIEYAIVASATSTAEIVVLGSGMAMSSYVVSVEFLPEPSAQLLCASALVALFCPAILRTRLRSAHR